MIFVGLVLFYFVIVKCFEFLLLVLIGFGGILFNLFDVGFVMLVIENVVYVVKLEVMMVFLEVL